jgi:Rrf2 family protein
VILTRSVDSAMRLLIYLARREVKNRYMKARQIERDLKIRPFALRKILWALTRGGLLRSVPGRRGGFRLRRRPGDISLAEVMTVVEGPIVAYPCRGVDEGCEQSGRCAVAPVYQELERELHRLMSRYSLKDCLPSVGEAHAVEGRHA